MKKLGLYIFTALLITPGLIICQEESNSQLIVYYFHNTRRCATCNAIESKTVETLDTYFKDKIEDGTIQMIALNAEKKENKEICEKYEIWGSTLLLVKDDDGKWQFILFCVLKFLF